LPRMRARIGRFNYDFTSRTSLAGTIQFETCFFNAEARRKKEGNAEKKIRASHTLSAR